MFLPKYFKSDAAGILDVFLVAVFLPIADEPEEVGDVEVMEDKKQILQLRSLRKIPS